ncbi:MAG: CDP-glycerol glycerophosphotransferase family protein [Clostridiales bacterium]|nr:CDP-glycerol glycerophosphotransferase family protein [Clostridiales bacterium]
MSLKVSINNGTICIARTPEKVPLLSDTFENRRQLLGDYCMLPLGSFPFYNRYTVPYPITPSENEKLYLFRELTDEERQLALEQEHTCTTAEQAADLETMKKIETVFGVRLWSDEDEAELARQAEHGSLEDADEELASDVDNDEDTGGRLETQSETDQSLYIAVFSHSKKLFAVIAARERVYRYLVRFIYRVKKIHFTKTDLVFDLWAKLENPYHLNVGQTRLAISEARGAAVDLVQEKHATGGKNVKQGKYRVSFSIPISALSDFSAGENSPVPLGGNLCSVAVQIDDCSAIYLLSKKASNKTEHGIKHSVREAWVPLTAIYAQDMALHVRRTAHGTYIFIKRHMEPIEYTPWFRFMESIPVSALLFYVARLMNHLPFRKKVALFYEKYSAKAEEGTYELFQRCVSSKRTRCYYVIDKTAPDYQRIKDNPRVVKKFSFKYYWLFFHVNYFIATDSPIHLSLLNANNRYIRWNCIRHPFIFLQHGITYLKRHGEWSTYLKDHPGEVNYVIVSSKKEKCVVAETFHLNPDHIFKTGMPIFDSCEYKHINQDSPDKITIMLTWKPYEESLDNYEDSTYYRYTLQVYEMLLKYVDRSQINIVAHPRAYDLLMTTSLHDLVWTKPISEVLKESKLLITDYSSVCWNSFYQGGGVVFFQPDLDAYEAYIGKLVPQADEYIGPRTFTIEELEQVISAGVPDGTVHLDQFRTEEFERRYNEINEFHDGKNTERVYKVLKKHKFI